MKKHILLVLSCLFLGCASTTILKVKQGPAKIYADGRYLGEGDQVTYSDAKIAGSSTLVEVKREGHEDEIFYIKRNAQLNVGALIGGIFLWIPLLWILDYENQYIFELEKSSAHKK